MKQTDSALKYEVFLANEGQMNDWGAAFGRLLSEPCQIHFIGNLGAGKTTLIRGVLAGLGYSGVVQSPTYTLIEPYQTRIGLVYHMDLYRLGHGEELEYLGIRDMDDGKTSCFVEWPEKAQGFLPEPDLVIALDVARSGRQLGMTPVSSTGEALCRLVQNRVTADGC